MNTLKILIMIFIASIFLMSCNEQPCIRKGVTYPDLISPIYFIDTFQIDSPRVALIDSVPYIFSLEKMMPFEDEKDFLGQTGVILYLTPDLFSHRYINYLYIYEHKKWKKSIEDLIVENKFYFDKMFLPDDSLGHIPVYKFAFDPEGFILTFISEIDSVIGDGDQIFDILYSSDYSLTIAPLFSKSNLKTINELWYRKLHGRELDWSKYLKWYERIGWGDYLSSSGIRCRK